MNLSNGAGKPALLLVDRAQLTGKEESLWGNMS